VENGVKGLPGIASRTSSGRWQQKSLPSQCMPDDCQPPSLLEASRNEEGFGYSYPPACDA
jgi:hypothetical protein